jgi:hypothetical protein
MEYEILKQKAEVQNCLHQEDEEKDAEYMRKICDIMRGRRVIL